MRGRGCGPSSSIAMFVVCLSVCLFVQSGDSQPGTTLAFTIIPVHDESYDVDYEPVSICMNI